LRVQDNVAIPAKRSSVVRLSPSLTEFGILKEARTPTPGCPVRSASDELQHGRELGRRGWRDAFRKKRFFEPLNGDDIRRRK
jgi:hypothetical protein